MTSISVIIPSYNTERFLAEAITSVTSQTETDVELVVVDDGSSDHSMEIIKDMAAQDNRIRPLSNTHSKGVSGARNTALDVVKGEWIAFLDSDDIMCPGSLEVRLNTVRKHPDCKIMSADFARVTENGVPVEECFYLEKQNIVMALAGEKVVSDGYLINDPVGFFLHHAVLAHTGTVFIHRSLIKSVGYFNESMSHGEDVDFWYRCVLHHRLIFIPKPVLLYRQRAGSATADNEKYVEGSINMYSGLLRNPCFFNYKEQLKKRSLQSLREGINYYRRQRKFDLALGYAISALRCEPFSLLSWRHFTASVLHRD